MSISVSEALSMPSVSSIFSAVNVDLLVEYEGFCNEVESKIYDTAVRLENDKKSFSGLGEDQLTSIIAIGLSMAGFDADHDTNRNGHADLLVKNGRFEWFGEAKLEQGPAYSMEGFRQLADRYTTGRPLANRGGLLLYSKKSNKKEVMDTWIEYLGNNYESKVIPVARCPLTLTQTTCHQHQDSGTNYITRHFVLCFYENATDKSARGRKRSKTQEE